MKNTLSLELGTSLIKEFSSDFPFESYSAFITNHITYEGFVAVAGFLYPEIINYQGYILLADNFKLGGSKLESHYGNDKKTIEREYNMFCVSDYWFQSIENESNEKKYFEIPNLSWQKKIAEIILYFWSRRVTELFPDIEFDFELHENGLFYEDGLCLTFSQK